MGQILHDATEGAKRQGGAIAGDGVSKAQFDALCEEMRTLDAADASFYRAAVLYVYGMTLISGQGAAADARVTNLMDWHLHMYEMLLRTAAPPDDEEAILEGLLDWLIVRCLDKVADEPRKHRKRRRRLKGTPKLAMRFPRQGVNADGTLHGDPHYFAAWFVERLRQHWCHYHGERRLPPGELKAIIRREIDLTRKEFNVELDEDRLIRVLRDPKERRFTKIFYEV